MSTLHCDPAKVGATATGWDDEHNEMDATADRISGLDSGCFTPRVRGAAQAFTTSWSKTAHEEATQAEAQADGLRAAAEKIIEADHLSGLQLTIAQAQLQETR